MGEARQSFGVAIAIFLNLDQHLAGTLGLPQVHLEHHRRAFRARSLALDEQLTRGRCEPTQIVEQLDEVGDGVGERAEDAHFTPVAVALEDEIVEPQAKSGHKSPGVADPVDI